MPGDNLFVQIAIRKGHIGTQELMTCHRIQVLIQQVLKKRLLLSEIMLIREFLSPAQYLNCMKSLQEVGEQMNLIKGVPLFGEIVVEKGFVTLDQLLECLDIQKEEDDCGIPHRLIGEILLMRGYLTPRQLEEALAITRAKAKRRAESIAKADSIENRDKREAFSFSL
jgi:hypothetical protein